MSKSLKALCALLVTVMLVSSFSVVAAADVRASGRCSYYDWEYTYDYVLTVKCKPNLTHYSLEYVDQYVLDYVHTVVFDISELSSCKDTLDFCGKGCSALSIEFVGLDGFKAKHWTISEFPSVGGSPDKIKGDCIKFPSSFWCDYIECNDIGFVSVDFFDHVGFSTLSLKKCTRMGETDASTRVDTYAGSIFLKKVNLRNGRKTINEFMFYKCKGLEKVTIPESVTTIEYGAFWGCRDLEELEIPDTITSIGQRAFQESGLYTVTIPSSITTIDVGTFEGCSGLRKAYLPDTITSIAVDAFKDCTALDVYYPGTRAQFKQITITKENGGTASWLDAFDGEKGVYVHCSDDPNYNIYVEIIGKGTVVLSTNKAKFHDPITISAEPAPGYELESIADEYGIYFMYTFDMPERDVHFVVTFKKIDEPSPTPTKKPTAAPTEKATPTPTKKPTATPTKKATATPTPTKKPTAKPTKKATPTPTKKPTATPTKKATPTPTKKPAVPTPTNKPISKPTSTWKQEDGKWYYYDKNGEKVTGWQNLGAWYYFDSQGVMQTGWIQDGSSWYYLKSSGAMATGWVQDGGKWYYMGPSGAMVTGWVKDGNNWYFMGPSGAMTTGWLKYKNTWYYLNESGAMVTGWKQLSGKWYYFESSGAMKTGWLESGGKKYYLTESGAMATGTIKIDGKTYKFDASGALIEG